ncbi:SCP-2 sterol transfer family protein [Trichostrongylus colubriformis]|uniref:SCP-2 sterol transfer family protein n=1 Tax=Trichostrongylus colubriformis TaxID=6319 RepID=A0AAN8FJS0_TRICO
MCHPCDSFFEELKGRLAHDESLARKVHTCFKVSIKAGDGTVKTWTVDTKSHPAYVGPSERAFDVEFTMEEKDFMKMTTGLLKPDEAFRFGKMRIKGLYGKALRFKSLFKKIPNSRL